MTDLQDIVASTEAHLSSRPDRLPNYQAENRALNSLARDMADRPEKVLSSLCEQLMLVCNAESAGVSLFDGESDFIWPAVTGAWAPFQGGRMPQSASPCGVVVNRNVPLLFHNVEQQFPAAAMATPRIEEILLVPFRVNDKPQGTVWAILHSKAKRFDREDLRLLESLGQFAAAAYQMTEARRAASEARAQVTLFNDTLELQVAERTAERDRMWNTSPDLMLVIGFDGLFRRVNPAWTTLLGYGADELLGHHLNEFLVPDDHQETVEAFEVAAQGGRPRIENRYRHKDGSVRTIAWVAAPAGEVMYATGRDVTDERLAAEELTQAHEALRQAQKMEAVGQLTGGLAHDFNNLLAGMMGNLELLQMRIRRGHLDDLDRFINAAQGAGRRAAALTQRLLAFSRRQTLDPKPTDVNRLLVGLHDLLQRTVGATVNIKVAQDAGLWVTQIDGSQLENAIINLCINGRDAMPDGGKLTIETANKWIDDHTLKGLDLPSGEYVSICVTDTGTGMSPETVRRSFEPFFTTKPIGQGTGLGLSMIYGFARQSGGQVHIYSEVGQGTAVCIYLPRHHGDVQIEDNDLATALVESANGQTVLVVDDEATIRHIIDEVLDELGYTVIGAADGAAGIKVLQSGAKIELLITDVGLPNGMNGRQLADEARRLRPGLKVLFITGFAENAAVGNGHLEPGMELLTKPFSLESLSAKVADMLKKNY